jgi:hypothetical protein
MTDQTWTGLGQTWAVLFKDVLVLARPIYSVNDAGWTQAIQRGPVGFDEPTNLAVFYTFYMMHVIVAQCI